MNLYPDRGYSQYCECSWTLGKYRSLMTSTPLAGSKYFKANIASHTFLRILRNFSYG